MRRFRIAFGIAAAALAALIALLVARALESVESERRLRHQAVAERVFDEMERALSAFLSAEEGRPFGQYGYFWVPPGASAGATLRSPLSGLSDLPFVVGHFQIDPDGTLHTPLRPRTEERARLPEEWRPAPPVAAAIVAIEKTVGAGWRTALPTERFDRAADLQRPGSTVGFAGRDEPVAEAVEAAPPESGASSPYDALRALNKGVEQRADRQAKVSREYAATLLEDGTAGRRERDADAAAEAENAAPPSNEAVRLELSPMIGRLVDPRHLVLYRTVVHETRGYRQGLLVDLERLGTWLREQALGSTALGPRATVAFGTSAAPEPPARSDLAWRHRFAEPFESLTAGLELAPLPGLGGAAYVYGLSAALALAAVLALAALYRMVSVVLRYAEQRGSFVAAVTHELRTPLTAIRMYGEMLRDGMVPSEAKREEYYRHITGESERLTRLVNNVLEHSRLERGARPMHLERGSIGAVVEEVATLVRPHVEREGFRLEVDVEPDLPAVRFDRDALVQVLFNLVDNAVKYANGAAPRDVTLRCARDGEAIVLSVRDRGPGVAPRDLGRIFDPFYRAGAGRDRAVKGTGLGLSLVRGLAERMGARVRGHNPAGGGFEVELRFRGA